MRTDFIIVSECLETLEFSEFSTTTYQDTLYNHEPKLLNLR